MKISNKLERIQEKLLDQFQEEIQSTSSNIRGRLRVIFTDSSFLDIRFPRNDSYSFHFQGSGKELRIDCAPYHDKIETFPNHFHKDNEIYKDKWTDPTNSFEKNIEGLVTWIKDEIMELL